MDNAKKYYRDLKRLFSVYGKEEKTYLNEMKVQIDEYAADNPGLTYDELEEEFGSPNEVISAYYLSCDSNQLIKKMRIRKFVKRTCLILIILSMGVSLWKLYTYTQTYIKFKEEFPYEWEEVIEEIDPIQEKK